MDGFLRPLLKSNSGINHYVEDSLPELGKKSSVKYNAIAAKIWYA